MATTRRAAANAGTTNATEVAAEIARQLQARDDEVADVAWQMPVATPAAQMVNVASEDDEFDEVVQSPADRIATMLRGINDGDRAYMNVSRVDQGNQLTFCAKYSAADFEAGGLELIRDQWGPGQYQLILYGTKRRADGTDHFGIRDRTTVRLAAPLQTAQFSAPKTVDNLQAFMEQQAKTMERMLEALTHKPEAQDPMAQMMQMLTMAKMMREAFAPPPAPAGGGIKDIIESVQAIMDVKDMVSPPAVPETPMGMVSQLLPLVQTAMQQRSATPTPAPQPVQQLRPLTYPPIAANLAPAVPAAPAVIPVTPVLPPPAEGEEVNPLAIINLRKQLAVLFTMAREGKPVEEGAELLYEHLPDDFIVLLQQDNWFDMLKAVASEDIEPIKEWLTATRAGLFAIFEEEAKEDAQAASAAGGASPVATPGNVVS